MDLKDLADFDFRAALLADLKAASVARFKADCPDAPDWLIDQYADALIGSLTTKRVSGNVSPEPK